MVTDKAFAALLGGNTLDAFISLFEDVSGVLFWVKDDQHRVRALNTTFAERVKMPAEDVIGKTDRQLYYTELARVFMADDQRVLETGVPMRKKVELLATRFGTVEWRSTTKLPLRDREERIIGTTGISRPLSDSANTLPGPYHAFGAMIEYARANLANGVDVDAIAAHSGMSVSSLARRFREHLRITPGEFLGQLRISRACQLLSDSPLNITEVALECGYESPAAFSRAFRRQMQVSPKGFRARE